MLSVGIFFDENIFVAINPYLNTDEDTMPLASDDSDYAALLWSEALLSSSTYGLPLSYSTSWYSSLSDVEVVARAIYCEGGTAYTEEDSAVAWVILNRIHSSKFDNTAASVVKASSQFSSITGKQGATQEAGVPSIKTDRWEHSTYLTCLLLTTTSKDEWSTIVGNKISGQLYFYSYTTAQNTYENNSPIFTGTTNSNLKYNGKSIEKVYVLGYGNVSSFTSLFKNYKPINYSRNIYYDFK